MYSKKINQLATNLNPQSTDLIPIGDATTGQLKTTTFNNISGVSSDGIISGGIVTWTGTGLNFNISACVYYLNGIRYTSPFTTKTLAAADPTNPRIDVFAVNTSGQVEVIQGTPNVNPVEPEGDTETTLGLTNVTINAGATTPNGVTRDLIYDENVESWTKTNVVTGAINYADTAFANTGTKSILVTMNAGYASLSFANASTLDISNFKSISFAIRLNSAWTLNTALVVSFYNAGKLVSNRYQLIDTNTVGFNRNLAAEWQTITIPLDGTILKFKNNIFNRIIIGTSNAAATYRLDTISLNSGINNPTGGGTTATNSFGFVNASTGTATATQATDTLTVVGTGLATTSATGKTLTIAVPSPIPSLTSGSVLFSDGTTIAQDNANFFWNDTTNKLGIGTNTPSVEINISKNQNAATGIDISNTTSDSNAQARLLLTSDGSSGSANIGKYSTGTTPLKIIAEKDFTIYNGNTAGDISILNDFTSGTIKLASGGSSTSQLVLKTTGQLQFNNYTSSSSFTGTAAGYLGFDSSGNIITTGAAGASIGGTVTGGTTGSVLFIGASSALAQDNANFFWDDTSNSLGIGTNAPSNDLHILKTGNISSVIRVENTSTGTASNANLNLFSDATAGYLQYQKRSSTHTATGIAGASSALLYNSAGDLIIGTGGATSWIRFATNGIAAADMNLTANGRLLLGTSTESTFLLDVNGTARASQLTLTGSSGVSLFIASGTAIRGSTSGQTTYIDGAPDLTGAISIRSTSVGVSGTFSSGNASTGTLSVNATCTISSASTPSFRLDRSSNIWYVEHSRNATNALTISQSASPGNVPAVSINSNGNVSLNITTGDASALLDITSTTKGFLPPRMTTTQKNAIATPAAGLIVYDTTLGKLCVRTASAWETITSV